MSAKFDLTGKESEIERDAKALSYVLGLDRERIRVQRPDWLEFMRQGVIVTPHVRRWRGMARLTAEDLGLTFDTDEEREKFEKSVRLGELYLLPKRFVDRLSTLESRIRKLAWKYGYKTHWGWLVPAGGFLAWKEEQAELEAAYRAVGVEIENDFQAIVFEVADTHSANARAAYRREQDHVRRGGTSKLVEEFTEAGFVRRYVDAVLDQIPSAREIVNSIGVDVDFDYIPLPAAMAEEQAEIEIAAERVEREREITRAEVEMRRAVAESTKRRVDDLVVSHLKGIVTQLNQILLDAATDIVTTVKANTKVHPRSVVQLKSAVAKVRSMVDAMSGYVEYSDVERMLSQAERLIDTPVEGKRDTGKVIEALENIATVTKQTLLTLGETPRAGREGEIMSVPTAAEVRQARKSLGLDELPMELVEAPKERRGRREL